MHFPVDHPLRGLYRGLAILVGLFQIVFGVVAFIQTRSLSFFDTHGERVLGLTANPAFGVASIVFGALVIALVLIRGRVAFVGLLILGAILIVNGTFQLALIRTSLNYFAFSVTNVVVSFIIGLILLAAGLYSTARTGPVARPTEPSRHATAS